MVDASPGSDRITVEVIYPLADRIWRKSFSVPTASTVAQALQVSGVLDDCPELSVNLLAVGIYGVSCSLDHVLSESDRLEIYRPLHFDPKESRRRRALHKLTQKRAGKLAAGRMRKANRLARPSHTSVANP